MSDSDPKHAMKMWGSDNFIDFLGTEVPVLTRIRDEIEASVVQTKPMRMAPEQASRAMVVV